jgi:hypothetical protein
MHSDEHSMEHWEDHMQNTHFEKIEKAHLDVVSIPTMLNARMTINCQVG